MWGFRTELSREEFNELVEPKLRLFLSVDVIDSTKLKNDKNYGDQGWLSFFSNFYSEFPLMLSKRVNEHAKGRAELPEIPTLWKCLGDELVFSVVLKSRKDAWLYMKAFKDSLVAAISNYGHH